LHHEPTVHRMRWVENELFVVPLHGRGNKNGEGDGVKILAYKMPSDPKQQWTTKVVDDTLHLAHNFQIMSLLKNTPAGLLVVPEKLFYGRTGERVRVWLVATRRMS